MRLLIFLVLVTFSGFLAAQEVHTEYSRTRFEVIVPLLRQSRFAEAETLTRQLLRKAEAELSPNSLEIGRILFLLADIRVRNGFREEPETLALFERSVQIKLGALGQDHDEAIAAQITYANALKNASRNSESHALLTQVVARFNRDPGKVSPAAVSALNGLATQLWEDDEAGQARPYSDQALTLAERLHGPESVEVASVLSTRGFILSSTGDVTGARNALQRALRIRQQVLGESHRLTIAAYNNLASILNRAGEIAEGRHLYEKANAARSKLLGPDHPDHAIGLNNLGQSLNDTGDYVAARQLLDKALALRLRTIGENHRLTGTTYLLLARNEFRQLHYETALGFADKAVDICGRTFGTSHQTYLDARTVRAAILSRMGQPVAAFQEVIGAAKALTENSRLLVQSLGERAALSLGSHEVQAADYATDLIVDNPELGSSARREVWDSWIRTRSMVLDEISARLRFANHANDAALDKDLSELQNVRRRLSRLVLTSGSATQIQGALDRKEQLERRLAERSAELRLDWKRLRLGFADVAAGLPPKAALVSFVRYRQDRGDAPAKAVFKLAAFILRAGEEDPSLVLLGDHEPIERLVQDWRAQIGLAVADPSRVGIRAEALARKSGTTLRQKVWDPIQPYTRGAEMVLLVPDGALNLVSFGALPAAGNRYLVETGPLLHMLSAERDIVLLDETSQAGRSMLAMANPAFNGTAPQRDAKAVLRHATPACSDLRSLQFGPLPSTATEVSDVAHLWSDPSKPVILSGAAANESSFRKQAPGKRIVHIATHGFFLGNQCGGTAENLVGEAATQSPLVLSGLALAGANRRYQTKDDEEDGLLTAEEVATLPLQGVEWVVLSGCDTGLGQISAREGVFGLRRAFQMAGAGTVIMSLWPVEDSSAREWMRRLYTARLSKNMSTAEALRDASRTMLAARRAAGKSTHPFFWSAFVGAGNWR